MALVIAAGLAIWVDQHKATSASNTALKFKFLESKGNALDPKEAHRAIGAIPKLVEEFSTHRSRNDFWLFLDLRPLAQNQSQLVTLELQSKHATNFRCWATSKVAHDAVGESALFPMPGSRRAKAGFALDFDTGKSGPASLLCQSRYSGPAHPQLIVWESEGFRLSEEAFDRSGGLLFGALLALTAFSALIAALNRDTTFAIYAIWLLAHLRIAAVSGGWDLSWMNVEIDPDLNATLRQVTLPLFALTTATLFGSLFASEIKTLKLTKWQNVAHVISGLILLAAITLPNEIFLLVMWALSGTGALILIGLLTVILRKTPSRVAGWYGLSWFFALLGVLSEVLGAATGISAISIALNPVSGSIFSSLLAGISLAERLNSERSARLAAQGRALGFLRRFQENYNSVTIGLFTAHLDGNLREFNPAFGALFGLKSSSDPSTLTISWNDLFPTYPVTSVLAELDGVYQVDKQLQQSTPGGEDRWLRVRITNKGSYVEGSVEDITQRQRAEKQLRFLADHDPLTYLLNRRGFTAAYAQTEELLKGGGTCCLAYIDLDRFKLINDLFGHVAGDQVLKQLADRLSSMIKPPNALARIGGDEFLILFLGLSLDDAHRICEQVLSEVCRKPYSFQDKAFSVDASIGLVRLRTGMSERDAMAACDRACADAKKSGGASVAVLDETNTALRAYLEEIQLVATIKERFPEERFFTQFQPIFRCFGADTTLAYEVLVRLREPNGTVVPPAKFIGAAERNGLMTSIDRWVVKDTLTWLEQHPEHLERLSFATVNLSGASLNDERFVQDIRALLRDFPDIAPKVCFEITESVALYDMSNTRRFVDILRTFGSMIALDDFGAGYTSFNYLKDLRGDFVKIDGSFVRDINSNPANYAITQAIADLSHELGMSCVAEWAETLDIVESLQTVGVDYAQGYVLAKPMERSQILLASSPLDLIADKKVSNLVAAPMPQRTAKASKLRMAERSTQRRTKV